MFKEENPILIVGAGPTGLTLACELARRCIPFRIIDKAHPFAGSRAKGLQPRTLEILEDTQKQTGTFYSSAHIRMPVIDAIRRIGSNQNGACLIFADLCLIFA